MNYSIEKKIGEKKVIDSDTLLLCDNNCEITVNGFTFEFIMIDEIGAGKLWKHDVVDNDKSRLKIKLYNLDNPFHEGNFIPVRSAIMNGHYVYITYSLTTVDAAKRMRILSYNILLGEVAE